ncbi:MAG: phosphatidylserine decarboxylase [Stellaceae bacterium]
MRRILIAQLVIVAVCLWAVGELAANFPYPAPLIRPFLTPKLRWPTAEIKGWVNAENYPSGFLEYFARDPHRTIPAGVNMVAPSDGQVQAILHHNGISYLVIGLSFWDVHVIRAPAAGTVTGLAEEGIWLDRGNKSRASMMNAILEGGKDAPVQQIITFQTRGGLLKVHMITSYWASRLKVWVYRGQQIAKGQRIGRILLGSTTVLEAPGDLTFLVKPGQRVVGGETIVYRKGE